jgi:CHASE3 domain sensor protein
MKNEVKSMEQSIATTVIEAIRNSQPTNVEVDHHMETESTGSASHDTTATMKTMMDRFESLAQIVVTLTQKVTELTETHDLIASKRSRPIDETARQILQDMEHAGNETSSPPSKLPRPSDKSPPATPPPNGHLGNTAGAREER